MRRFISVDPLAAKYPGWSPYTYTLDNPVKYIDPDGRFVGTLAAAAAVVFMVLANPDDAQAPTKEGDHVEKTFGEKTLNLAVK